MKQLHNINILIIGGAGNWSRKTYIKALQPPYFDGELYLVDIKERFVPNYGNCKYFKVNNENSQNIIRKLITDFHIKFAIISTPPVYHDLYLELLLKMRVNLICDKPLISVHNKGLYAKETLKKYLMLLNIKNDMNLRVYTPLRRKVQSFYKKIYNEVSKIQNKYKQNVTFISYYENDGVHRWNDELEMDFAHGYSSGLGKLSHTGYHILDIIAYIITIGNSNISNISCKIIDINMTKNNNKCKSNKILQEILKSDRCDFKLQRSTQKAELDIAIKITINFTDDIPANYYIFLRHSGATDRTVKNYNKYEMGDQGRVGDSHFVIEQGGCQCIYGNINAVSRLNGAIGKSSMIIKRHKIVAKSLNEKKLEIYKIHNSHEKSTIEIVRDIVNMLLSKNYKKEYDCLEYSKQFLTMELYCAILFAKENNKSVTWTIGNLNDYLY